ncbi:MAG: hypothetical protein JWR37_988 [Mycobacterium sp.]|nr:hypothetical protein [Mycobacterium sp.]
MAAEIVPIRLGLTKGDLYTLWAPRWRDAGDEWEAFLGKDEDLYAFESVADLVTFVRTDTDNDLTDHPAWEALTEASAHRLDPPDDRQYDLIGVQELAAEKPTEESVNTLHRTLAIVSAIGSVCELPAVTKFFNGNPMLGSLGGGAETFSGRTGNKRWLEIEALIAKSWDNIVDAIDEIVSTPDVDAGVSEKVQAELLEPPEDETDEADTEETDEAATGRHGRHEAASRDERDDDAEDEAEADEEDDELVARAGGLVLGTDEDFWAKVGIDPVRMMTGAGTFYTLRCYLDNAPIFLGRNGRISVFSSERALARYLADEHDHDLSDLSTYDDIRTAATDGSLEIDITEDNVYVLTGLSDDIADGPDAVDRDQLELAVELLRDVGEYSEDDTVEKALNERRPLGRLVGYVLESGSVASPAAPYAAAAEQWSDLEQFVESRLRRE